MKEQEIRNQGNEDPELAGVSAERAAEAADSVVGQPPHETYLDIKDGYIALRAVVRSHPDSSAILAEASHRALAMRDERQKRRAEVKQAARYAAAEDPICYVCNLKVQRKDAALTGGKFYHLDCLKRIGVI